MAKILIVEDDLLLADILEKLLLQKRHIVEKAPDGLLALDFIAHHKYDLVILDWNLPKLSGVEIAKELKARDPSAMILMLTSKTQTQDKVEGFQSGADDYMTKPVAIDEFGARVLALLRRAGFKESRQLRYKNLVLELESGVLQNGDKQVSLPPKEFELMELLMRNTDNYLSTESVLERLWGGGSSRAALANCLKRLRSMLSLLGHGDSIETVASMGYRLKPK
jgi:DNA-binding response OmpR family regulator